jgi:hypothetical protein
VSLRLLRSFDRSAPRDRQLRHGDLVSYLDARSGAPAASIKDVLPWSVVSHPLSGEQPTIDLVVGYRRDNDSPILRVFLNKLDELLVRMALEPNQPAVA